MLALWAGCASSAANAGEPPRSGSLITLSVSGSGGRVVVDLVSDQTLDTVLEVVRSQPARLFVDLRNVVPKVDSVTEVGRGAVRRVRVGLNQSQPPVTRVVVDLEGDATYYLEQGKTQRELRITVLAEPAEPSSEIDRYSSWFTQTADTMARLLARNPQERPGTGTDGAHLEQLKLEWNLLRQELGTVQPPPPFKAAHDLLVPAGALGNASTTSGRDGHPPGMDASSAQAGASLLLRQARSVADAHLAATDLR